MIPSAFSTQITTSSTTAGSTKGFLSFSSQSVIDSTKGPTLSERFKYNCLHLSANLHRYKKFGYEYHNFAMLFRMIQNYCIFLMPSCNVFWESNSSTSFFTYLFGIPIHFCILPNDYKFHSYFEIVLSVFFLISAILIGRYILKNPDDHSTSNAIIFYISLFFSVLTPIFSIFVYSIFGALLKNLVIQKIDDPVIIAAIIFGAIAVVLVTVLHVFSFFLIRGNSKINFNAMYVPWTPFISTYALTEFIIMILAFLEEFLPINELWYQIGFSLGSAVLVNPYIIYFTLHHPIFQDVNDGVYFSTQLSVNILSIILINLRWVSPNVTPTLVISVVIISFVLFLILYKLIIRKVTTKYIKNLYSVYKQCNPVLPPITPLVFSTSVSNQVPLSHEAYSIMQAFASLEIKNIGEFQYYLSVGSMVRMPAVVNIDFIKWGLNSFNDPSTLIICAQICQHFEENGQTQTVLIQKLKEIPSLSIFMTPVLHNLELDHTDVISDKPLFLKLLQKKANAGLARSRRALSLFWGCVLKHSQTTMKESLCRLRDSIYEANLHFDELIRCYPLSLEAIGLYLNFLTEIKGQYLDCNRYINEMSATFIEMKSNLIEDDESIDGISLLLQDSSRTFSPYISKLSQYMEQERQAHENTNGPIVAIWTFAIFSIVVLITAILYIIIKTLVSFQVYPKLLEIVDSCDNVIISLASLVLGTRRLCLFSAGGLLPTTSNVTGIDSSIYDSPESLIPYLLNQGEELPNLILLFYQNVSTNAELLDVVTHKSLPFNIFGVTVNGSLNFVVDMMCMAIRDIATNIPSLFENIQFTQRTHKLASLQSMLYEKMKKSFYNGMYSSNFHNVSTDFLKESSKSKIVGKPIENRQQTEGISNFTACCNSSELYLLMENVEVINTLCTYFIDTFIGISQKTVLNFDTILYYSMILFPILYTTLFALFLFLVSHYIKKEGNFRLTLFLSLPEQVASEIFRSGGMSGQLTKKQAPINENQSHPSNNSNCNNNNNNMMEDNAVDSAQENNNNNTVELISPEVEQLKSRALTIESLYQFSRKNSIITGTGLSEYIVWCCIYCVIAALTMFGLTYYAKSINETFHARSLMLCYSAFRYSASVYSAMFIQEGFFENDITIFNSSEIIRLSSQFLEEASLIHRVLTYGSPGIQFDFREYETIKNMMLKDITVTSAQLGKIKPSYTLMQHEAYRYDSIDAIIRVFIEVTTGMINTYRTNGSFYAINDKTWENYNHLVFCHMIDSLESATFEYLSGVSKVISSSFIIALLVSLLALVIILLLVIGPILISVLAISRYFSIALHVLCQVPPDVFQRSIYIKKWLKGQISRSNYNQYENAFKRTVSPDLQKKIIDESPEKIILFSSNGEYIDTHCFDLSNLESFTLPNILTAIIGPNNSKEIEIAQNTLLKFQDAKDQIDNFVIMAKSESGKPIKLTMTGITSADLSSSITSVQRYYSCIAILMRDVTNEANEEEQFEKQKAKTLSLLEQIVPTAFANRLHDGERRISFSSGIGSVMAVSIDHFDSALNVLDLQTVSETLYTIKKMVNDALSEFENVSMISSFNGEFLFVAGLFNDEQNGRTEAFDTLQFAVRLNQIISEISTNFNVYLPLKFGICTGGPIYCKVIMDGAPVSLISGDTVQSAKVIRNLCKPNQLLLERTTYECSYGLNIDAQLVGELDFQGRHTAYYSIAIDKVVSISNPM